MTNQSIKKIETPLKHHERHAIVEATAETVGALITNVYNLLDLKETIKCRYDINGTTYRMTFEKLPPEPIPEDSVTK